MQNTQRRDKIRTLKGFVLSLLLHLLIVLLFWVSTEKFLSPPAPKQEKKITLDLSQFVPPAPPPKPQVIPVPPPQPVTPPQPKPKKVVEKKPEPKKKVLDEKKIVTAKKDIQENNDTKSAKKPEKKVVKKKKKKKEEKKVVKKEKKVVKKKVVKKSPPKKPKKKKVTQKKPRKKQYASPLASSLMGSGKSKSIQTSPRRAASPATRRMIKQLYGSEFNSYGAEQKKFIENNLAIIHRITQTTLNRNGYPEVAARTGQQGVNVVSFYLHPKGNISKLRLEKHMGHEALDRNTLQVIRIAYKDYPLPRKKTKIKFFVQYSIDGY